MHSYLLNFEGLNSQYYIYTKPSDDSNLTQKRQWFRILYGHTIRKLGIHNIEASIKYKGFFFCLAGGISPIVTIYFYYLGNNIIEYVKIF